MEKSPNHALEPREPLGPLVSILLPVYNSMDFVRSEGLELLPKALNALLNQSYKNFELLILDNQSTDKTPQICRSYAAKDSRIRYILDDRKRDLEAAVYHYALFIQGKYCMIANDDDLWHPDYIKKLVDFLEQHSEVDMAYSNGYYVNMDGSIGNRIIQSKMDTYNETASPLSNYCAYIQRRNPVPILFGVFKTETYRRMLPFEHFDKIINANVDNLFMAKFFLMGYQCHYVDNVLFSYRGKRRKPELEKPLLVWLQLVRHQFYFYKKLDEMFSANDLPKHQQYYVKCVTLDSCLKIPFNLLEWIKNTYAQGKESEVCSKTLKIFKKELNPLLCNKAEMGVFPDDEPDIIRFQPPVIAKFLDSSLQKITAFNRLIEYYNSLLDESEPEIVRDIQELLQNENSELEKEKVIIDSELGKTPEIIIKEDIRVEEHVEIKDETPKLSVISCSMNLGRFLEETILSVARQSFKGYEHIVIDGGSTDETLEILKRYPHIKWISEKDSGYREGFWKGLAIAKGKYVMQCAVSDGYLDKDWFKRCVEALDSDPEISLVWGFPQYLTEDSRLGDISYPQFHQSMPPQKYEWLSYWLRTNFWFPEGNFCARKEVFERCFQAFDGFSEYVDEYLEFNYNFNSSGYLPYHIPVVANFGRTHEGQLGQKDRKRGGERKKMELYMSKVRHYRWKLLTGMGTHVYRDGAHKILHVKFSNEKLRREYIEFITGDVIALAKKYLPVTFLTKVKRIYRMFF